MKNNRTIGAIVVGGLVLVNVASPMIIEAILEAQIASSVGIIGGADGPTAVMVVGTLGVGSVIAEVAIGILLLVAGIWGYRKYKKK